MQNFLGGGEVTCFQAILCILLSGSKWWSQVSSTVTKSWNKVVRIFIKQTQKTGRCFSAIHLLNVRHPSCRSLFVNKFSVKIKYVLPVEMPIDSAMKSTDSHQSFPLTKSLTFSAVSLLTAADGRPQWCSLSHNNLPRLNSLFKHHFLTVEYAGADSPNVSFIYKKSVVLRVL